MLINFTKLKYIKYIYCELQYIVTITALDMLWRLFFNSLILSSDYVN